MKLGEIKEYIPEPETEANKARDFLWKSGPRKPEKVNILRIFNQLFKCTP